MRKRICAVSFAHTKRTTAKAAAAVMSQIKKYSPTQTEKEKKRKKEAEWEGKRKRERETNERHAHIIFSHHVCAVRFSKWFFFLRLTSYKKGNRYAYLSVQFDEWNKAHGWTGKLPKIKVSVKQATNHRCENNLTHKWEYFFNRHNGATHRTNPKVYRVQIPHWTWNGMNKKKTHTHI